EPAVVGGLADDREWAALPFTNIAECRQIRLCDGQNIAFLGLVAPDLARRHAAVLARDRAQVDARAAPGAVRELGKRVRQAPGADVVDREDRVRRAELPAAVDHLLRAALDLGVVALHRVEVELLD